MGLVDRVFLGDPKERYIPPLTPVRKQLGLFEYVVGHGFLVEANPARKLERDMFLSRWFRHPQLDHLCVDSKGVAFVLDSPAAWSTGKL